MGIWKNNGKLIMIDRSAKLFGKNESFSLIQIVAF